MMRAASRVEYDGYFANNSHILQQVLGASLNQRLGSVGNLALRVGRAWDRSSDYVEDAFQYRFETQRDSAGLQWDAGIGAGQTLTLGADFLRDHVSGTTEYTIEARDNTIVRMRPRPNEEVNKYFMCDHGRLNYRWLNWRDRVDVAMVRQGASLTGCDWERAIAEASGLMAGKRVFVLASPMLSNEALFVLSQIVRRSGGATRCAAT